MQTLLKLYEELVIEFVTTFTKIPKRIGRKAFGWLIFYYSLSLIVVGSSLRVYIHNNIDPSAPWVYPFLSQLDRFFIYIFWLLVFCALCFFAIFIWRFFSPLGILLQKSRDIRKGDFKRKYQVPIVEERGEWFLLDLSLNKISRDLKKKKADVEKERGELEALITAANDAILAIDNEQNIRYYNAPMALLFDQKEEGSWGRKVKEVIRNQNVVKAFEKALQDGHSQRIHTSHEVSLDSSTHFFDISISPLESNKGKKARGAVAIFHDVTGHKKVEKIRMDFVANASHEIKTPVTSIQGYLGIIRQALPEKDPNLTKAFETIEKNVQRLNRLVSDLLSLSKIESSDEISNEPIDVETLTRGVVEELSHQWKGKNQHLSFDFQVKSLTARQDYCEQVIINLVENAIKYCPEGAKIRVRWKESEGGVVLSVKDNGPGIESYHQGRLFERFYRVRDAKDIQNVKGTGLGLSIVRHAMLKMGGHVDVKSAPGLGTEFICYFKK